MCGSTNMLALLVVALLAGVSYGLPPKKIVGGATANPGEFPYQVSLRMGGQHFCGGSILSSRFILTAAHCITNITPEMLTVATGTTSSAAGDIHAVYQITGHPEYQHGNTRSEHDIAILALADEIQFDENTNKISLPTAPTEGGVRGVVSGWGYVNAMTQIVPPNLLKTPVTTISNSKCREIFGRSGTIYESQICTYDGPGVGVCNGDSGGPLAVNGILVGVVSLGVPCAVGIPDLYTSTYHHLEWIRQNANTD